MELLELTLIWFEFETRFGEPFHCVTAGEYDLKNTPKVGDSM